MRLIAINSELTHGNHVINRDYIFESIDRPNIYIYIYIYIYYIYYIVGYYFVISTSIKQVKSL